MAEAIVERKYYAPIITMNRRGDLVRIPRTSTRYELPSSKFVTHNGAQVVSDDAWIIKENN